MCGHYSKHDKKKRVDYYTCSKCERKHYFGDPNYRAHYQYSGREKYEAPSTGIYEFEEVGSLAKS
jgi:hypothetical protein